MSPEASEYLRQIEVALREHGEQRLFASVEGLLQEEPLDAALLIWAAFFSEADVYFRRVLAYALAKTAAGQSKYLWGPLAAFVTSPYSEDDATLVNVISALQTYHEDEITSAVLAPEFGAFTLHCISSGALVVDAFCDLLLDLNDRGVLPKTLSRSQVRVARGRLEAMDFGGRSVERGAVLAVLRDGAFIEVLPDATSRLDLEEDDLLGRSANELDRSVSSSLRSVLARVRSSYTVRNQAQEVNGVVQEIRITGSESTTGRLEVDVFEKLVRCWKTAVSEVAKSISPKNAPKMKTYMLAPAQGSFIMRFLIESARDEILSETLDEIAELAEKPEELASRTQLNSDAKSNIFQFAETLAAHQLDATVGTVDPRFFERPRKRIISSEIRPALEQISAMKEVQSVSRHFSASLEGASRRLGTFEAVDEELKYVRGEVPPNRRSMLLNKVIGRRYDFAVEERVTTSGTGDEKRQWILESVNIP